MSQTLDKKIDSSSRKDEKVHLALKNHYYLTLNALATTTKKQQQQPYIVMKE